MLKHYDRHIIIKFDQIAFLMKTSGLNSAKSLTRLKKTMELLNNN
jgi:hypothetical protein